ncbi:uncharacterized protein IWZ02DRAFT_12725 [Phyllosticta citriasiana]|uniref:uncharacterized protein n=1 Tax=Phyllosticta citriasiana TaxID=595635 RepID=UPI0030FD3E8A
MVPPLMPIGRRDIASTVDAAKSSFSSWDKCMAKTYCKWPVIVVIVVASLIALSLLWCCFRCLCCGAQCCCGCFRCCNACCPSPRKGHRRVESPPPQAFPVNQPYQAHPPMYSGPGWQQSNVPQFATFDVSKDGKVNDDALPAMPSWDTAKETKVEVEETPSPEHRSDLEMDRLDCNGRSPVGGSNPNSPMLPNQQGTPGANNWHNNRHQDAGVFQDGQNSPYGGQNNSYYGQSQGAYGGAAPHSFPQEQQPYHYADGYGQYYDSAQAAPYHNVNRGYPAAPAPAYSAPSPSNYSENPYAPPARSSPVHAHQQSDPYQRAPSAPYQRQMNHSPIPRNQSASPYQAFNPSQSPAPMPAPLRAGQQGGGLGGFREV